MKIFVTGAPGFVGSAICAGADQCGRSSSWSRTFNHQQSEPITGWRQLEVEFESTY